MPDRLDDLLSPRMVVRFDLPVEMESIPSHHLIVERAANFDPSIKLPTYNIYEVSRFFFGWHKNSLTQVCSRNRKRLADHPWAVTPYKKGVKWDLDEVERLIHMLYELKVIPYTRMMVALQLVAWNAKAYGLNV